MIPAEIYTAVTTAIITATVTLLAVHLTNRSNVKRLKLQFEHERTSRRDSLYRERVEELYVLSSKYAVILVSHNFPYLRVMEGELDYNQALDLTIESGKSETPDFDRLGMLIDIYFPELSGSFKRLLDARNGMNDIISAHKSEYKQGKLDGRNFVKPMLAALEHVEESGDRLKKEIVAFEKTV